MTPAPRAGRVEWSLEATVSPTVFQWDGQTSQCWATDAAFVNGRFYFYVSAGAGQIGVMVADSDKGPWADPLGKPLMSGPFGAAQHPSFTNMVFGPCGFNQTDDKPFMHQHQGTYYLSWGCFCAYSGSSLLPGSASSLNDKRCPQTRQARVSMGRLRCKDPS